MTYHWYVYLSLTSRFIHITNRSMRIECIHWSNFIFIGIWTGAMEMIRKVVITKYEMVINAVVNWVPLIFWVFTLCLALQSWHSWIIVRSKMIINNEYSLNYTLNLGRLFVFSAFFINSYKVCIFHKDILNYLWNIFFNWLA